MYNTYFNDAYTVDCDCETKYCSTSSPCEPAWISKPQTKYAMLKVHVDK